LTPEFLSQSEQTLFKKLIPKLDIPLANDQPSRQLGDLQMPTGTGDFKMRVQVVMPDGQPVQNTSVELGTSHEKPLTNYRNQLVARDGRRTYRIQTDSNGICTLIPSIHYDVPQYAAVAFPRIDPRYFGQLRLKKTMAGTEPELQTLQLVATREIHGLVEYNRRPAQAMRIIATPVGKTPPENKSANVPTFFEYQAASDSDGRYAIRVPQAQSYLVDLGDGAMLGSVTRRSMESNLPVPFEALEEQTEPADRADSMDGPKISIFRGNGFVRGEVLGSNGKPFYAADVHFDLPPGYAIVNLRCREVVTDENGRYKPGLGRAKFEVSGVPEGLWQAYGCSPSPMTKTVGNQPKQDSPLVPVSAGDEGVIIRLDRYSR